VKLEGAALRVAWEGAGGELELRDSAFCWEAVRAMAAAPDLLAAALAAEQRHGERTAAALGRVAAEKAALEQRLLPAAAALLQRKRERNTELYRQLSGAAAEARSPGPTPPKRRPPPRKGGGASLAVPAAPAAPAAVGAAGPAGAGGAAPVPYAELPETESEGEGPGGRVWQPARPWGRRDSEERYVEDTDAEEAGAAPGPGGGRTPPRSPREQRGVTPPRHRRRPPRSPGDGHPPGPGPDITRTGRVAPCSGGPDAAKPAGEEEDGSGGAAGLQLGRGLTPPLPFKLSKARRRQVA